MTPILRKDTELVFPSNIVVSASAGSGKTYTLAQRYVQFLLSQRIPNNNLRNILAITFTNLAAKEMRQRVLDYLKALSMGREKQLAEMSFLVALDAKELRKRAGELVDRILDGYSEFQVKTIDSFMVSIFKASALDFGFNPDVEIQLTNDTMIDEAFEVFGREFNVRPEQAQLLDHLVDLLSQTREGKKRFLWDPYNVLAEEVKSIYELVSSQPKSPVLDRGGASIRVLKQRIEQKAKELHTLLVSLQLPIQRHLENDLAQAMAGDIDPVLGRTLKDKAVGKLIGPKAERVYEGNRSAIDSALAAYNDSIREFCLARSRSYYDPYLEAIAEVGDVLESLKRTQGKLFIHDINKKLVGKLVLDIVPDVYFRLGETIYHYLIDEFQDTAPIQWANLKPLIENSLAQGSGSLFIVGDTKQSIYAFRFADWMIMRNLMTVNQFPSTDLDVRTLATNWRSDEQIVKFTRTVFEDIIQQTPEWSTPGTLSGLASCEQEITDSHKGKGYVETNWFARDDDAFPERTRIVDVVRDCRARGFQYGDIALLTPNNEDVIKVSGWLNQYRIPFISHSSLDIRTRKVTGEILSLLQFFDSPVDNLAFSTFLLGDLLQSSLEYHGGSLSREQIHELLFTARETGGPPLYKQFQERYPEMWKRYFEDLYSRVGYLPLYDFVSDLLKVFDVFKSMPQHEGTFVKLLDVVKQFEESGNSSTKDFLLFALDTPDGSGWEMDVPPGGDAVTLMTIHKAKGLDFPVVIVLLYDWWKKGNPCYVQECDDSIRLLRISEEDADKVDELAVVFNEQRLKNQADELNKLYVALTRAKHAMFVISVYGKDGRSGNKTKDEYAPSMFFPDGHYGTWSAVKPSTKQTGGMNPLGTLHLAERRAYDTGSTRRQELSGMARGDAVHAFLAKIEFLEGPVEQCVDRLLSDGEPAIPSSPELRTTLVEFLSLESVREFFVPAAYRRVLREQEFANASGMMYRLDRVLVEEEKIVVVDFKTGGDELEQEYREQVGNYVKLLKDVFPGKRVEGILAYVDMKQIRTVT